MRYDRVPLTKYPPDRSKGVVREKGGVRRFGEEFGQAGPGDEWWGRGSQTTADTNQCPAHVRLLNPSLLNSTLNSF